LPANQASAKKSKTAEMEEGDGGLETHGSLHPLYIYCFLTTSCDLLVSPCSCAPLHVNPHG